MGAAEQLVNLLKVIDSAISRISIDDNSILHSNENEISAPLLSACCDIRDKLRVAIDIAGSISSTNIECLLHVLALKREHAVTVEKHSKEVELLKGRIESLSSVLQFQTARISDLSELNSLSKFWSKFIFPQFEYPARTDTIAKPSSASIAMSYISAYCSEQMSSHFDSNDRLFNSNLLLRKIVEQLNLISGSVAKFEAGQSAIFDENNRLRELLSNRDNQIQCQLDLLDISGQHVEINQFAREDLNTRFRMAMSELNQSKEQMKILTLQTERERNLLRKSEEKCKHITSLYFETLSLCQQWKSCFDNMTNQSRSNEKDSLMSSPAKKISKFEHFRSRNKIANEEKSPGISVQKEMTTMNSRNSEEGVYDGHAVKESGRSRELDMPSPSPSTSFIPLPVPSMDDRIVGVRSDRVERPPSWSASTVASADSTATDQIHPNPNLHLNQSTSRPSVPPTALSFLDISHQPSQSHLQQPDEDTVDKEDTGGNAEELSLLSPIYAKGLFTLSSGASSDQTEPPHRAHYQLPTENFVNRLHSAYKDRQKRRPFVLATSQRASLLPFPNQYQRDLYTELELEAAGGMQNQQSSKPTGNRVKFLENEQQNDGKTKGKITFSNDGNHLAEFLQEIRTPDF